MSVDHTHSSESSHHDPVITRNWKRVTVAGNLALGGVELLTGNVNTLAVAADGVHNISDGVAYNLQGDDLLHNDMDEARLTRRRKIAYWIITASSATILTKAGLDLQMDVAHEANDLSLYAAGASLLFSSAMFYRLRQGIRRQHYTPASSTCDEEKHISKHFKTDLLSAGLAVGGVIAQKHGFEDAEQLAAGVSSAATMFWFFPTAKRIQSISH